MKSKLVGFMFLVGCSGNYGLGINSPADVGPTNASDAGSAGTCSNARTLCGSTCVDLNSDPLNCGACGDVCQSGLSCNSGFCGSATAPSDGGIQPCAFVTPHSSVISGDNFVMTFHGLPNTLYQLEKSSKPSTDPADWTVIATEESNADGEFAFADPIDHMTAAFFRAFSTSCGTDAGMCPTGKTVCSGACVDLNTDNSNCSACGHPCQQFWTCSFGSCVIP